jgi:mono/diheme cytochrome c family protein
VKTVSCLLIAAFICIVIGCRFYFDTTKERFSVRPSSASLANGRNIAYNVCAGCHYNSDFKKFVGMPLNDLPKIAGRLVSANLTHSKTHGVTDNYSDAELFYLLKTGISKSGKFMPYMMRPTMADQDINDLIVFLRSDDPSLKAADTTLGKTKINFIGKIGIRLAAKPQPYTKGVKAPDKNDEVAYGRYLVGIIGCYHCHSKKVLGLNYSDPEKSKGYMQGGIKLKDPEGKKIFAPNLTPDKETGIGGFSLHEFSDAVRKGIDPSGKKLSPPMPEFSEMTDHQLKSIYTYLQHLKPVKHRVKSNAG